MLQKVMFSEGKPEEKERAQCNNMQPHETVENIESRPEIGQKSSTGLLSARLAKTHVDYWKPRLRRRTYPKADGTVVELPEWHVKMAHGGEQRRIGLETANKDAAAKKARDTWIKLKANGWEAVKPDRDEIINPTVGDFLSAVRADGGLKPATFEIYAKKFRRLVAGVFGIKGDAAKHDYINGGYDKWLARVHAVKFARITLKTVNRWASRYTNSQSANPIQRRRAERTIASVLRSSKALFATKIVSRLHLSLPTPLPLEAVAVPRVSVEEYESRITPELLFQQAQHELDAPTDEMLRLAVRARPRRKKKRGSRRHTFSDLAIAARTQRGVDRDRNYRKQMFRAFCLGLFAGLRRDEIDTLTWAQIDFTKGEIRVETNEYTSAKSLNSERTVDIDPGFSELLRTWNEASTSKFVIETDVSPRPEKSTYHHYRCAAIFRELVAWLRSHGVTDRTPLHTMRKEFGTQINRAH